MKKRYFYIVLILFLLVDLGSAYFISDNTTSKVNEPLKTAEIGNPDEFLYSSGQYLYSKGNEIYYGSLQNVQSEMIKKEYNNTVEDIKMDKSGEIYGIKINNKIYIYRLGKKSVLLELETTEDSDLIGIGIRYRSVSGGTVPVLDTVLVHRNNELIYFNLKGEVKYKSKIKKPINYFHQPGNQKIAFLYDDKVQIHSIGEINPIKIDLPNDMIPSFVKFSQNDYYTIISGENGRVLNYLIHDGKKLLWSEEFNESVISASINDVASNSLIHTPNSIFSVDRDGKIIGEYSKDQRLSNSFSKSKYSFLTRNNNTEMYYEDREAPLVQYQDFIAKEIYSYNSDKVYILEKKDSKVYLTVLSANTSILPGSRSYWNILFLIILLELVAIALFKKKLFLPKKNIRNAFLIGALLSSGIFYFYGTDIYSIPAIFIAGGTVFGFYFNKKAHKLSHGVFDRLMLHGLSLGAGWVAAIIISPIIGPVEWMNDPTMAYRLTDTMFNRFGANILYGFMTALLSTVLAFIIKPLWDLYLK